MGDKRKMDVVFRSLDGIHLDTFGGRKIFQKKLYFLQQFGLDLGYAFQFYMYGPYSRNATEDAFGLQNQNSILPNVEAQLSGEEVAIVEKLNGFLSKIPSEKEAYSLELLSSLHFLYHLPYLKGKPREEIEGYLRKLKPQLTFSDEEVAGAWKLLESFGLLSP